MGGDGPRCSACGAENTEVEDLFAENRALQRKLEFEKASAQHDLKKKDDQIVFLTKELAELRDDLEMMIKGEKGGKASNPILARLLKDKNVLEEKYKQEKEVTGIRIVSMQETMIENLTTVNTDLKRQLDQEIIASKDDDRSLTTNFLKSTMQQDQKQQQLIAAAEAAAAQRAADQKKEAGGFFSKFKGAR